MKKPEPETIGLENLGWRKISRNVWCWREPKTRALYKVQDALDLVASQVKAKKEVKK
jgi:hypothetical protein